MDAGSRQEREEVDLAQAATFLIEECRMVLPGVQAIFGFQLIAGFQQRFAEDLPPPVQWLHFGSLTLVALAAALVMTPAALHRITGVQHVTRAFLERSSRLLLAGMWILAVGLSCEYFVIGWLIFESPWLAGGAMVLLALLSILWYFYPRMERRRGM